MIKIDGVQIKSPSDFEIKPVILSRDLVNANGGTFTEVLATKQELVFKWSYLSSADLKDIRDKLTNSFEVTYPDDAGDQVITCYQKNPIERKAMVYKNGVVEGWKDVTATWRER